MSLTQKLGERGCFSKVSSGDRNKLVEFSSPMMSAHPQIECNLCGQSSFTVLEDDQQPHRVLKCDTCSLVFVYPHPDPAGLRDHYDMAYYQEWLNSQKRQRLQMWERRLEKLKMYRPEGNFLDIGCGEGTFLDLAQKNGWEISGTEVSEYAARYASDLLKVDIFNGDLPAAGFEENTFDVVTMWHVLEHVENPMGYLSEIKRVLKPEGLFVLAVPNVGNRVFQIAYRLIKGRKMKLFTLGEKEVHLYHFSAKTIQAYLKRAGFDCVKLSPDFGIIDISKKVINWFSVIFYYLFRMHVYDAVEIYAVPQKKEPESYIKINEKQVQCL